MQDPLSSMAALAEMATTSSRVEEAGRMSSIEWEPKTLSLDQIKFAREAALYVVSTKTEEEAIRIFTEGLKPVQMTTVRDPDRKSSSIIDSSSDDDVELGCGNSSSSSTKGCCGGGSKGGRRGRRRRSSIDDDRDVATAPF